MILAALRTLWGFAQLIPLKVYLGVALLAAAGGWILLDRHQQREIGREEVRAEWKAEKAEYQKVIAREKARQAQVVEKVVVEYQDRVKVIKEKGDEIVREVEKLVPGECKFSGGFRVLHDAGASGVLPDDPAGVARTAPPVDAPTVAVTVLENYSACRQNAAQLLALQKILKESK